MKVRIELDLETLQALRDRAFAEMRTPDVQAGALLRQALGLAWPVPLPEDINVPISVEKEHAPVG